MYYEISYELATNCDLRKNKIYEVRGQKIMLDFDLAELYEVETRRLNEQVKRNQDRFPEDFMFRLTEKEMETMRSQIVTGSGKEKKSNSSQIATSSKNFFYLFVSNCP